LTINFVAFDIVPSALTL